MFDQYVVKNRHSLKLRYLGPIRCSTRFCRPTAIMGSRAIGRSEVYGEGIIRNTNLGNPQWHYIKYIMTFIHTYAITVNFKL